MELPNHGKTSSLERIQAYISYPETYVQPLIIRALQRWGEKIDFVTSSDHFRPISGSSLQFAAYEDIDFEYASERPSTSLVCAYVIRKALIRKHFLSNTI